MTTTIPEELADLVQRPIYASLGTVRPDNTVQVNPMWFEHDGEFYVHLGRRYGNPNAAPPPDKADRVVLVMSIEHTSSH